MYPGVDVATYEQATVLHAILSVTRVEHLRILAQRDPALLRHLKRQLARLEAEEG